ncbi:post-transcriptional regulator [Fictibacillus sp. WQ 8-8]|uniref:post-transcriptional regulator n=2 Tax=Fictibacillus TaxID=1329200 RepID=UPI001E35E5D7|nr:MULTISPECIES: post-transcriptional regulator [unclassified Fictibacillus]MCQ6266404.1 post-transcriptional regulator [Fictibacillus sp. WQ 8-8]MED2972374.1 post-transcriptional regulator [Fictibacillus sp. B-59209]
MNESLDVMSFEDMKTEVEPALQCKAEEFHFLGYESVSNEEVWNCVMRKAQKKKEEAKLHVLVGLILGLSLTDFMNWLTLEAFKRDVE